MEGSEFLPGKKWDKVNYSVAWKGNFIKINIAKL